MTEEIIKSMSLNKILIAILEQYESLSVPYAKFVELTDQDKELVVEYESSDSTFKFSLRDKNGE